MPSAGTDWDVAVVGGGPAGAAAALSLRLHAPSLSVVLIEASRYDTPRVGEVLPAAARPLLAHLGIWEAFEAERFRPVHASAAAWGAPVPVENHFLFSARGHGWHLDRTRFDALLAHEAERRGSALRLGSALRRAVRDGDGWSLALADGARLGARVLIHATGRRWGFARPLGARLRGHDRLVGCIRHVSMHGDPDPRTLVEAVSDGWWYTAAVSDRLRIVAFMTDADLARERGLDRPGPWLDALAATRWVGRAAEGGEPHPEVAVRAAGSVRLDPAAGEGWLAAGDAACAFDPLSSLGISKALRSGIFAGYAAADLLRGDAGGLVRHDGLVRREFEGYRRAHMRTYAEETRWPGNPFWARRAAGTAPS